MASNTQEPADQAPASQNPQAAAPEDAPPVLESRLPTRKDTSLREFLTKMDDYAPIVRMTLR
jgi:transcription initiation factor TFIID subunit 10